MKDAQQSAGEFLSNSFLIERIDLLFTREGKGTNDMAGLLFLILSDGIWKANLSTSWAHANVWSLFDSWRRNLH